MKTNKIIITLQLLAAILFVSCSSDNTETDGGPGYIVFGTRQAQTRGTAHDGTLPDNHTFGVYAYRVPAQGGSVGSSATEVEPGYMGAGFTAVTKLATGCTYSPGKAWPSDLNDRVKFFAYYPHVATTDGVITSRTAANVTADP